MDEGRTVVELRQRLSLDLTTVSIDSAWDVNKWTMSFGQDYGVRAERGDLRLIYSYLEQELTSRSNAARLRLNVSAASQGKLFSFRKYMSQAFLILNSPAMLSIP